MAIELLRRRREMFYFRQKNECDFILKEGTRPTTAIQVCWELTARNRKRELRGLSAAMDTLDLEHGLTSRDEVRYHSLNAAWPFSE